MGNCGNAWLHYVTFSLGNCLKGAAEFGSSANPKPKRKSSLFLPNPPAFGARLGETFTWSMGPNRFTWTSVCHWFFVRNHRRTTEDFWAQDLVFRSPMMERPRWGILGAGNICNDFAAGGSMKKHGSTRVGCGLKRYCKTARLVITLRLFYESSFFYIYSQYSASSLG